MKKAAVVVIVISLIVFVTTLTAGVYLTVRTIGWSDLMDSSKINYHVNNIFRDFRFIEHLPGDLDSFTIDELHEIDMDGITAISISGLSERISITTDSEQIKARLSGSYLTRSRKITWLAERSGNELKIHIDYPSFGLVSSDLQMDISIPAAYTGDVKVNTLSGPCVLPDQTAYSWSGFTFDGLSGSLNIANADMAKINFNSLSGSIEIDRSTARIRGDTMSGKVLINLELVQDLDVETLSGNVEINLPADADCKIEFSTLSGSFRNNGLDITYLEQERRRTTAILNSGDVLLRIETMSGNLIMAPR